MCNYYITDDARYENFNIQQSSFLFSQYMRHLP